MRFEAPLLMGAKRYFKVEPRDAEGTPGATSAWINTEWHIVGIDHFVGSAYYSPYSISACTIGGIPSIAYISFEDGLLRFVQAEDSYGATWQVPYEFTNLARLPLLMEIAGNPAIFFSDYADNTTIGRFMYMRAANPQGTQWNAPVALSNEIKKGVDDIFPAKRSVVLDRDGFPIVAYIENDVAFLVRALNKEGSLWSEPFEIPLAASEGLDLGYINDTLHIAYVHNGYTLDNNNDHIFLMESDQDTWKLKANLGVPASNGPVATIMIDTIGAYPGVIVIGYNSGNLSIARSTDQGGVYWGPFLHSNYVKDMSSLSIVTQAGILYVPYSGTRSLGIYRSASDRAIGWLYPIIVDNSSPSPSSASLLAINKSVSMAYWASSTSSEDVVLRYAYELTSNPAANRPPEVVLTATPQTGESPLYVDYRASSLYDPDGVVAKFEIDYDGDGIVDRTENTYGEFQVSSSFGKKLFESPGEYDSTITVYDEQGASATSTIRVTVNDDWGLSGVHADSNYYYFIRSIDADGAPGVAWSEQNYGESGNSILYSYAQDGYGGSWNSPIVAAQFMPQESVFEYEMANIGGFPFGIALLYSSSSESYKLNYFSAIDARGSAWMDEMTLTSPEEGPGGINLLDVGGLPLIIYFDINSKQFRAMKGNDRFGSSWIGPLLIETLTGDPISEPKAAIIAGKPSLIYSARVNNNYSFRYIAATSEEGTEWENSVVIEGKTIKVHALSALGELPVIAYFDYVSGIDSTLKFRKAVNQDGTVWAEPVELDPDRKIKYFASSTLQFLFVDGKSVIAYSNDNGAWICRTADSTGVVWNPVQQIVNYSSRMGTAMKRSDGKLGYAYRESNFIRFAWER